MEAIKTVLNTPSTAVKFTRHEGKLLKFVYSSARNSGVDLELHASILTSTGWHPLVEHGDFETPDSVYNPEHYHNEEAFKTSTNERAKILFSLMEEHITTLFPEKTDFSIFDS